MRYATRQTKSATLTFRAATVTTENDPELDETAPDEADFRLIELFFFAYRDFIADPDAVLADLGFGRAHHRVLHFVARQPGLTVTELRDILKITKQSLAPVMRQLVDGGYLETHPGERDRRQRHLHATQKGLNLSVQLTRIQSRRLDAALDHLGALHSGGREAAETFLLGMLEPSERDFVARWHGSKER